MRGARAFEWLLVATLFGAIAIGILLASTLRCVG
jgi:hypothetical protein